MQVSRAEKADPYQGISGKFHVHIMAISGLLWDLLSVPRFQGLEAIGAFTGRRTVLIHQRLHCTPGAPIWDRYVVEQARASYITRAEGIPVADEQISEQGRQERFARWEQIGVDRIKADLSSGGHAARRTRPHGVPHGTLGWWIG